MADYKMALAVDRWGNSYVSASAQNDNADSILTAKIDSHGTTRWIRNWDAAGEFTDTAASIVALNDGRVAVVGTSQMTQERTLSTVLMYAADVFSDGFE